MTDRPTIYYGLCEGGPWHQKHLADARTVFSVMIDPTTKKPIPGAQAGTKGGDYVFEGKVWVWHVHDSHSRRKTGAEAGRQNDSIP